MDRPNVTQRAKLVHGATCATSTAGTINVMKRHPLFMRPWIGGEEVVISSWKAHAP
jgi:hypothetical protein